MKELKGRHVFGIFATGFAIIITVNMTLAWNAVSTFPGLEVKNSYVASQAFNDARAAQEALGWDVAATLNGDSLILRIEKDGTPVRATIDTAILGRATSVAVDQTPEFHFNGHAYVADVTGGDGNWNLRLIAHADDGTEFKRRIIVDTAS